MNPTLDWLCSEAALRLQALARALEHGIDKRHRCQAVAGRIGDLAGSVAQVLALEQGLRPALARGSERYAPRSLEARQLRAVGDPR